MALGYVAKPVWKKKIVNGSSTPIFFVMSRKSAKIAALIEGCQGKALPAHYLAYFECFNRGLFYEAHDVLEELWLTQKNGVNHAFYKGLIQLAGAFVHLQRHSQKYPRLKPSAALFKLAAANLGKYPAIHEELALTEVAEMIGRWLEKLEGGGFVENPLGSEPLPTLSLHF